MTVVIPTFLALPSLVGESGTLGNLERKGLELIPQAASPYGQQVVDMFWVIFWICAVVFALVMSLLVLFIIKYRAKKGRTEGEAIHGNTKLEIIWTVIPFAIIMFLVVLSTKFINDQAAPPSDTLVVKIVGSQFKWDFEYYEATQSNEGATETVGNICGNPAVYVQIKKLNVKSTDEMVLPVNRPVRFLLTATDVLHSFWIPEILNKKDAVPGLFTDMWFTPTRTGDFVAKCTELCGPNHSLMTAKVSFVEPAAFETWKSAHPAPQKK